MIENRKQKHVGSAKQKTMKTKVLKLVPVILFLAAFTIQAAGNISVPAASVSGHEYQYQMTSGTLNLLCLYFSTSYMVQDADKMLPLESWMTDPGLWDNAIYMDQEQDFPLRIESWMADENKWYPSQKNPDFNETIITGSEAHNKRNIWECMNYVPFEMEGLIISDSWMTDDHVWCNEYFVTIFVPLEK